MGKPIHICARSEKKFSIKKFNSWTFPIRSIRAHFSVDECRKKYFYEKKYFFIKKLPNFGYCFSTNKIFLSPQMIVFYRI